MAIKGKSKPKGKSKAVARAPRREPVTVKPPLFQRRWIQLVTFFVLGVIAMTIFVWVTNGLRQDRADKDASAAAATRLVAANAWQREVESAVGNVGTVSNTGQAPAIFADTNAAIDALKKGSAPAGAAATFGTAVKDAQTAIDSLTKFDVAGTIRNQGFDEAEALFFTDSKDRLVNALTLYQKAAETGKLAVLANGAQAASLTQLADELRSAANTEFQQAWSTYGEALVSGGNRSAIPLPTSGFNAGATAP